MLENDALAVRSSFVETHICMKKTPHLSWDIDNLVEAHLRKLCMVHFDLDYYGVHDLLMWVWRIRHSATNTAFPLVTRH